MQQADDFFSNGDDVAFVEASTTISLEDLDGGQSEIDQIEQASFLIVMQLVAAVSKKVAVKVVRRDLTAAVSISAVICTPEAYARALTTGNSAPKTPDFLSDALQRRGARIGP